MSWSALGTGIGPWDYQYADVLSLAVYDDGTGPALYAAGEFLWAGGQQAKYIAKWNGNSWSAVGGGMNDGVAALAVFDDGTGAALYAGGDFTTSGGVTANGIAKWDGAAWAPVGSGFGNPPSYPPAVHALAVFDDGTGPSLYAAGGFGTPASHIAEWSGHQWLPLGSGLNHIVKSLAVFDYGNGPALYAGGYFTQAGGTTANNIARWRDNVWSPVGGG